MSIPQKKYKIVKNIDQYAGFNVPAEYVPMINQIVNTKFKNKTNLFLVELELDQISHLIDNRIINSTEDMSIISTKEYDFELDETKYVVIFPTEIIDTFPEYFEYKIEDKNKKIIWNGHHREALLAILGKSKFKTSYLLDFYVNYKI